MISESNTKTLYSLAQNAGIEYGEKLFMHYEREEELFERTYSDLARDTKSLAVWSEEINQECGHKIHAALFGKCSYRLVVAMIGVTGAGGVSVPVDVQLSNEDLVNRFNEADIDVLFFDWELFPKLDFVRKNCPNIKYYICLQNLHNEMNVAAKTVKNLIEDYRDKDFTENTDENDLALLIYTSGTTGKGKGVMLSHKNLISNMFSSDEPEELFGETCLNVLPIHHVFCISGDILLAARYGDTVSICPDIARVADYINLFKPSSIRMVPMMIKMLVNKAIIYQGEHPEMTLEEAKDALYGKQLKRFISGGGYLAGDLAKRVFEMGVVTGQGYGMSECSPKISAPEYGNMAKLESVGRVVRGCEVRVVDEEIQVKSPSVMLGYYKEEELTKETITEDGYLKTGDLGYVDEDGFIFLTGRKKNLIILSNGENVAPEMIEKLFDGDTLVMDIIAYGKGETIAAEVYPNYEFAQKNHIENIEEEISNIVTKNNEKLPSYAKISSVTVRKHPFPKNSSRKIMRDKFFAEKEAEKQNKESMRGPETERQKVIFDIVSKIIGHDLFGIDSNLFECGLDSLGCIMLIEEVHNRLNQTITLSDLMECGSIIGFEKIMDDAEEMRKNIDYSVREQYPLTKMQMYFGYIIRGNTTGNLPFLFRMGKEVDLNKLKQAILDVMDAHPGMKGAIKPGATPYLVLFRRDDFVMDIPIINMSDEECLEALKADLKPFSYAGDDNLCHIKLYESEKAKYMFLDVSHIMGDGVSMNIIMEDINKRYLGEEIEKEEYTFYEYAIEEGYREQHGSREKDLEMLGDLMRGIKLKRSILTLPGIREYEVGHYKAIRRRFDGIVKKKLLNFCKKTGVTENVMFLSAFNYCISVFSDEKDVFSNSIHSGRTDSRWTRIVGPLFLTYYSRYTHTAHETVEQFLKKAGDGIMHSMKCFTSAPRQGEMFFQYQGDILEVPTLGGHHMERVPQQLDSLPFHMMVMCDDEGYYTELRYWENRFDRELLDIFLDSMECIVNAMLTETSVRKLKDYIPAKYVPKHFYTTAGELNAAAGGKILPNVDDDQKIKVYILDEYYCKKPYGGWGSLYIQDYQPMFCQQVVENPYKNGVNVYKTNRVARLLPDGSVDFLEESGRTVLTDGITGRKYYDLASLEKTLLAYPGVTYAEAYLNYSEQKNEMSLIVDLSVVSLPKINTTVEGIKEFVRENLGDLLVPEVINMY